MPEADKSDFFLSRRGSVAAVAQEVTDVLTARGYKVVVQDYDFRLGGDFIEAMHEAVKNARDLVVLFTSDYESSPYTRKEFTSFEANRLQSAEERRLIILRCDDVPALGLFAGNVYQDLVGIDDTEERRRRIIAAAEGHSLAQRPPPRPFVGAPPRIASFTGRADALDRLDEILIGGGKPAAVTQRSVGRAAVQGMGGVGKTSLAIEYAHRYRDLYAGVWWCPAESRTGLLTALAGLAVQLGVAAPEEADLERAAKAGLRRLAEQRATWLLVYDNVTSPDDITDLLPAATARVLITSRFPDWSGWAEEVALDVLPAGEAAAFLESRAGRQDAAGAGTLAAALGHLPLALDHAAAYCRRTQMRFADYAAKASSLIAAAPRGAAYPRSVAATVDLAISAAVAQCPEAEAAMAYLAQCAPERIPMSLFDGALDDEMQRTEALLALTEVSLVKAEPFEDGTPAVIVHRLVQAVAKARLAAQGTAPAALARVVRQLAATFPKDAYRQPQVWPVCAALLPHASAVKQIEASADAEDDALGGLYDNVGEYLHGSAAYREAEAFFRAAIACRERAFGHDQADVAISLSNLANVLRESGRLAEAEPLFREALAIEEKALEPGHPSYARILTNLASLLQAQGRREEAERDLRTAIALGEQKLGRRDPEVVMRLNNLANLLRETGRLDEAEPLFREAIDYGEEGLGRDSPDLAVLLHNLANLLRDTKRAAEAEDRYRRALAIFDKTHGTHHPSTARMRRNLAQLLLAAGRAEEARSEAKLALDTHAELSGRDHPWTRDSAAVLAGALDALGKREEAESVRAAHRAPEGRAQP